MFVEMLEKTYSDKDFLTHVVELVDVMSTLIPEELLAVKNIDGVSLYFSTAYAKFLNVDRQKVVGKKSALPFYGTADFDTLIATEDQEVIRGRIKKTLFKVNACKKVTPYVCNKMPIINPSTNNVVGIFMQSFQVWGANLSQEIIKSFTVLKKSQSKDCELPHLSTREKQIVFFFMAHLSSQEIADVLYTLEGKTIAKSTIDSYFNDKLYVKFNVNSRSALYAKLSKLGYDQFVPSSVLTNTSISLDKIKVY